MEAVDDIILRVEGLTVAFGSQTAAEGVTYALRRGRTLGIVGESGSGKSVSSMALMGLLPPQARVSGSALLAGDGGAIDLLALGEEEMNSVRGRRIAMIFQEPMTSLNPVHRCGAQVVEMLRGHERVGFREARERVLELFREVRLPRPEKIFDSYPHEISGGQKQRVMIAMALVCRPDILIADEPTTALDVTVQKAILDLLRSLQHRYGISIIFISHDLGVIGQVADEVLVMYRGRVVETGSTAEVLHSPRQPYTRGLLACRPPLDSRPRRLPTVEEVMAGEGGEQAEKTVEEPARDPEPAPSRTPLVSVRNLGVSYTLKKSLLGKPLQQLKAVDGISFDILEGETLGLVGESGCGKSTLGRALLRLIGHSEGSVAYRGTPIDRLPPGKMRALRPKLQIVFQDPYAALNPRITIGESILEPLRVHSGRGGGRVEGGSGQRAHVADLMEQVGLSPSWYGRYPHELSGGQRQRVCIARALILRPELVVCDESVSALDVSVQAQVLNLLNDLKERHHYTYLFITHDLSVVHYMADRIMVMQGGRIVESGTPDEIFATPQTDYTRSLISAIPRIG